MLFLWQKLWLMNGYFLKFKNQIFSYLFKVAGAVSRLNLVNWNFLQT